MFSTNVSRDRSETRPSARRSGAAIVLAAFAAAALVVGPAALQAQDDDGVPPEGSLSLTVRGGAGIPVNSAGLDGVSQTGGSFGAEAALHLSRRVAITAGGDVQLLEGRIDDAGVAWGDLRLIHLTAGPEFQFVEPDTRWTGTLALGAGITMLDQSMTLDDGTGAVEAIQNDGLVFRGAAKLGYRVADAATLFVEPGVYLITFDRTASSALAGASNAIAEPFDVGWTIPLQAGVRFQLQ